MRDPFHYVEERLHCEAVPAESLADEFGTPLYVYSRTQIETRYREFAQAFAALDPLIAYSVKANGNLSILRTLAGLGAGADIVSGGELYRALRAGVPPGRILFSGVGKTRTEMGEALAAGVYSFNVESAGELGELSAIASAAGTLARVAIRVNPDVDATTPHHYTRTGHGTTKFGVPLDEAIEVHRRGLALPGIVMVGIGVHIGSQILDPEPYDRAVSRVLDVAAAIEREGTALEFIDIGGGFGVRYEGGAGPTAADFARSLVPRLEGLKLRVVLEPGRFIVGPAGVLLTRVLYVKRMGDKTYVVTDAGMNDLLRPSHYSSYHRIDPVRRRDGRRAIVVDVVGPVCESGDFLALDRAVERPEPDDLLAIGTVGAYGFSMASTYNSRPRPAEVIVDGDRVELARRRETYHDLVELELDSAPAGQGTG